MLKKSPLQLSNSASPRAVFRFSFLLCFFTLLSFATLQAQCENVDGGSVTFTNGDTETTTIVDGNADVLSFETTVDAMANMHEFTYVVTDADGMILGIPPGNEVDFDPAGEGVCSVYGLSYTGTLQIAMGDDLFGGQDLSDDCFDLSSNQLRVNRVAPQMTESQVFASSNTSGMVGVFSILTDGSVLQSSFDVPLAIDADGIHYDEANDVLYQLNRTLNVVNAYSNVSTMPTLTASSTSNFTNGREIAVVEDKLIVADDLDGVNRLVVYTISPTMILLDRVYEVNFNLWGIHVNGNQLFAVVDNSSDIAVFDNFFNQPEGALLPSQVVAIENLVRTHGLTYVADKDMMFLTDIGDAGSDKDGAIIRIKRWSSASGDNVVSADEQIRVEGAQSLLGNPVDIAYDAGTDRVYVAERANGGGRILGFKNPAATGGIAPAFKRLFPGASAVHIPSPEVAIDLCSFVDGGTVTLANGNTEVTMIVDGESDMFDFVSDVDPILNGHDFTYVVTDADGMILGIPGDADMVDFDPAGVGACVVYGLSYTGTLQIEMGDDLFSGDDLSDDCFDLSSVSVTVTRIDPSDVDQQFFVSSNTSGVIGVYDILGSGNILMSEIPSEAMDADGIYYDTDADVLYQLNRSDNVINAYSNVSTTPMLTATSTSDFTNGREIAVAGGKLVVAQDGNAGNNDQNRLIVYDVSPTAITLDKSHDVDINLWGIHANGNQLFAIVDNSADVAVFNNFFNTADGPTSPDMTITIENMVRTHGLTYVADKDMMFLTDVGSGASAGDGAFVRIKNWSVASADGMVSADEQIRVAGGTSNLGNPVDIAYDDANDMVYIAERANGGGRVLCFRNPVASGGIAPIYNNLFPGASAIHLPGVEVPVDLCSFVDGGMVTLANGDTEVTMIVDGESDMFDFVSDVDPILNGHDFTYVVTDADGMILGIPGDADMVDFDPAGVGACVVYGLSYTGTLQIEMGDDLFSGDDLSDDCFDLSSSSVTVNRIEPSPVNTQFFTSSNTSGRIGVYSVLESGDVTMTDFESAAMDADGIYYDVDADVLYQLNRSESLINAYSSVSTTPTLTATSTSDFSNGREIAVAGGKLVVAQDANDGNGNQNRLVVYDITPTAITFSKAHDVDINLWGLHANGNQLFAIVDNSSDVAVFDNFFNAADGPLAADQIVTVDDLVRTHGITYVADKDMMFLTDVGAASSAGDGAFVRIKQWSVASADGSVSANEQIRVAGGTSNLGNPVDIAYDNDNDMVYVAERANGGGRILCFKNPVRTGGIAPVYNSLFAGASAIHLPGGEVSLDICDFVDGGSVALGDGGSEVTMFVDGEADMFDFTTTVEPAEGESFTYIVTDADGMILGIPGDADMVDFDPAGIGACIVYGLHYTGNLTIAMGDMLADAATLSDGCFDLSDNSVVVNRIAPEDDLTRLFISSNNQNVIGTYGIANNGDLVPGFFGTETMDADGIFYDEDNDIIYQLNRVNNTVDLYRDATTTPTLLATSTPDFMSGREIAVSGSKLVVTQDQDDNNKFYIYDITPNSIILDKVYDVDINLWGIHLDGERLIAVSDNTSDVVIYNNFFNLAAGPIVPDETITIEAMVRTHGLTYDTADDMLILTDVGAGGDANDGALVVVRDFADVSADGMVSLDEQARVFGGADFLGNPVDVALDKAEKKIYVAERANGGGRLLGFLLPKLSGGIAPFYNRPYPGISAVFIPEGPCDFLTGGALTFDDGTTEKDIIVNDGMPDVLSFISDVDAAAGGYSQTFVVTDPTGLILGIPPGNSVDFEPAGLGACRVYNVSYTGTLMLAADGNLFEDQISDDCGVRSDDFLLVNREEAPFTGEEVDNRSSVVNSTTVNLSALYPSPVTTELNVVFNSTVEENTIINVYNVAGSLVLQQRIDLVQGENKFLLNVSSLENGMFFIQLPGTDAVTKFVKTQK